MNWLHKAKSILTGNESTAASSRAGPTGDPTVDKKRARKTDQPPRGPTAPASSKTNPAARVIRTTVPYEPLLDEAAGCTGPIQGLTWFVARQRQDKHGDIADEFLEESVAEGRLKRKKVPLAAPLTITRLEKGNLVLQRTAT